jgi:hypothetical protein
VGVVQTVVRALTAKQRRPLNRRHLLCRWRTFLIASTSRSSKSNSKSWRMDAFSNLILAWPSRLTKGKKTASLVTLRQYLKGPRSGAIKVTKESNSSAKQRLTYSNSRKRLSLQSNRWLVNGNQSRWQKSKTTQWWKNLRFQRTTWQVVKLLRMCLVYQSFWKNSSLQCAIRKKWLWWITTWVSLGTNKRQLNNGSTHPSRMRMIAQPKLLL